MNQADLPRTGGILSLFLDWPATPTTAQSHDILFLSVWLMQQSKEPTTKTGSIFVKRNPLQRYIIAI